MGTKELKTKRLILRKYRNEDAESLYRKFGCNPVMYQYSGWNPYATKEMAERTVQQFIEGYSDPHFYGWIIEMDKEPAGTIGAYDYDASANQIEIGLSIDEQYWGKGIATEALDCVLHYLYDTEGISDITAWCAKENIGSKKAMEKAGMTLKEEQLNTLEIGDIQCDKMIYRYAPHSEKRS